MSELLEKKRKAYIEEVSRMGKKEQKLNPGDVFGMLTVVARDDVKSREKGKPYYLCQCSCGSPVISVRKSHLLSKTDPTLSCGCTKKTFTSIFDKSPELCKYWDYKKNGEKTPENVGIGSKYNAYWLCSNGHSYRRIVNKFIKNHTCPICNKTVASQEYSLAHDFPEIAKEWHPTKNDSLSPQDVCPGSNKKVWWVCPKGHEYSAMIIKRTKRGQGCPYCSNTKVLAGFNDLATTNPEVLTFWDYEKNVDIKPEIVLAGSDKKVWWKCEKGHSFPMRIAAKTSGSGCPICSHQKVSEGTCLATVNPEIAKEWHPTKNGELTPYDVLPSSHRKVWWLCPYGHEYKTFIYARQKSGCPTCNSEKRTSFPEQAILYYLGKMTLVESRYNIGGFEADVYCPMLKIAVEYDGEYYHAGEESSAREERKNNFFRETGILLFRIKETKQDIEFECRKTDYGFEIDVQYSQDYEFIDQVLAVIISKINSRFQKSYLVDANIIRDKIAILNQFAQLKDDNSFLMTKPLGAQKWDYKKNGDIDLRLLPKTSKKKYWWKCPTCGNEWYGSLDNIVNSLTCNKCARQIETEYDIAPETLMDASTIFRELPVNLQTENPDLASQWHPTKNGYFKPIHVTPKSGKRVWWLCPVCGNEWKQIIKTRNNGKTARKCPVCANNQKKTNLSVLDEFNPLLYEEWHPTKNGSSKLDDYTPGSSVKVWWKCSKCEREFRCSIKDRRNGGGCVVCGRKRTNVAKQKKVRNLDTNEVFESVKSAAESYGIGSTNITDCLHGRTRTAGGFRWEFVDDK